MDEDFECPHCGSTKSPKVQKVNEYTDADGNRGMMVTYVECRDCEEEI
jgi:transcription elongation factor Elf1